jgi:hypothetical protein
MPEEEVKTPEVGAAAELPAEVEITPNTSSEVTPAGEDI